MEQRTITQAEYEAMEKELEKELEAKDVLEVNKASSAVRQSFFFSRLPPWHYACRVEVRCW